MLSFTNTLWLCRLYVFYNALPSQSDSNEEDECTFDVDKAKVIEFIKDEKRWADKGVHPLKVLINKETKAGRYASFS